MRIVNVRRGEDNFDNWKRCLKSYLVGEGLWGVVSGEEANPNEIDGYNFKSWTQKNAKALHAIQISCEADTLSKLKETDSARDLWERLGRTERKITITLNTSQYNALNVAVENGEWEKTKALLSRNPNDVKAKITLFGDTILHVAVSSGQVEIVKQLMRLMSVEDLEEKNNEGNTAFYIAAMSGIKEVAKTLLEKNENLVRISGFRGQLPVVAAALFGEREIIQYIYKKTPYEILSVERINAKNAATLLNCLIADGIYDIAYDLIKKNPRLGFMGDLDDNNAIKLLAHKAAALPSEKNLVFWKRWIYSYTPVDCDADIEMRLFGSRDVENDRTPYRQGSGRGGQRVSKRIERLGWKVFEKLVPKIKEICDIKLRLAQAQQVQTLVLKELPTLPNDHLENIGLEEAIYTAIKCDNVEFIEEMINCYPEIIWRCDSKGRTLFGNAIVLRQEKIFSLIFNLESKMRLLLLKQDIFGNNFLHLAAKLSPSFQLERISGAALQMQKELQWFEAIKNLVPTKLKEVQNENGKTPGALFNAEHKELEKKGENWMKNTAGSCMVVATLIAAVMFTTAFQVPGGNNKDGFPNFLGYDAFMIFSISNSLSLCSSSSSMIIFLGILTSRYAQQDFLTTLPKMLIIGLFTLLFAIVTMMAAFGSATFILLQKKISWAALLVTILALIPIVFFSILQFPLLIQTFLHTYQPNILVMPKKQFKRK